MKTLSVSAEPDFPLSAYGSEKVAAPQGDLCQEKYTFPDSDFFSYFGYLGLSFGREKSLQAVLRALFSVRKCVRKFIPFLTRSDRRPIDTYHNFIMGILFCQPTDM